MNKAQPITCGIFYCRVSAEIYGSGSLQTSSRLGSNVFRNRQQKIPLSVTLHIKKNEKQHQYYKICTFVIIIKLRNYFDKNRT